MNLARFRPPPLSNLTPDLLAGLTVALGALPQSLAYAELAGVPARYGLLSAGLPALLAAFFVSCPALQTGATAMTALLTFGALAPLGLSGAEYASACALLALLVGVARVGIGLLRGGFVAYFLSRAVLSGFTAAAALLIVLAQLPPLLGISPQGGVLRSAALALLHPGAIDLPGLAFGLGTLGLVLLGQRIHRLFPSVLLALIASTALSALLGYQGPRLGALDGGFALPDVHLPWGELQHLLAPALVIAVVGFSEAASIARAFPGPKRWDPDREFVGQGISNLVSGALGGIPVGGSFSRSALNHLAGARTAWSGAFTGLFVLLTLPAVPLLAALPRSVMAMVVILAVANVVLRSLPGELWRTSRPQAIIGWATFAATLFFAPRIDRAVILGVALSLLVHLGREMGLTLNVTVVCPVLHLKPMGVLWFGTAARLQAQLLDALAENPGLKEVVIDVSGLGRIDLTGAFSLKEVLESAKQRGLNAKLCCVPPHAVRVVRGVLGNDALDQAVLPELTPEGGAADL